MDACGFYEHSCHWHMWKYQVFLVLLLWEWISMKSRHRRKKSTLLCASVPGCAVCEAVISREQWSGVDEISRLKDGSEQSSPPLALAASGSSRRARLLDFSPSVIIFSPISSILCMRAGLLFLTSVSSTDPDQFVYKTRPPRKQPDTSPDVMMNSYLGLWPLRWQINCLGHGHLEKTFLIHTEHKSFYFLFRFKWSTHRRHARVEALPPDGWQSCRRLPRPALNAWLIWFLSSLHRLRTATVAVILSKPKAPRESGWAPVFGICPAFLWEDIT